MGMKNKWRECELGSFCVTGISLPGMGCVDWGWRRNLKASPFELCLVVRRSRCWGWRLIAMGKDDGGMNRKTVMFIRKYGRKFFYRMKREKIRISVELYHRCKQDNFLFYEYYEKKMNIKKYANKLCCIMPCLVFIELFKYLWREKCCSTFVTIFIRCFGHASFNSHLPNELYLVCDYAENWKQKMKNRKWEHIL